MSRLNPYQRDANAQFRPEPIWPTVFCALAVGVIVCAIFFASMVIE